ncbi:hypothetical protein Leryth_027604 [Lithospermum erythrorhizon]|nr:hypothetical protein Leryth_027604 [Lithospermum erythrorhizon]
MKYDMHIDRLPDVRGGWYAYRWVLDRGCILMGCPGDWENVMHIDGLPRC